MYEVPRNDLGLGATQGVAGAINLVFGLSLVGLGIWGLFAAHDIAKTLMTIVVIVASH
jgi:hypothetical protein